MIRSQMKFSMASVVASITCIAVGYQAMNAAVIEDKSELNKKTSFGVHLGPKYDGYVDLRGDLQTFVCAYFDVDGAASVTVYDPEGNVLEEKLFGAGRHNLGARESTVIRLWGAGKGRSGRYRIKASGNNAYFFMNYSFDPNKEI